MHESVPVVVAGYGRVGHRVGDILTRAGIPFIALDSDAALVARQRARGNPVYFADLGKPGVLNAVGASEAQVIVVTLNDPEASTELVTLLRDLYPEVQIFARGHNLETCQALFRLGAAGVVSENVEASLELSRMTMDRVGVDPDSSGEILSAFRQRYHHQIHEPPAESGQRPERFRDIE